MLATLTGMLFRRWGFTEPNIVVVYIFAVLMTARFTHGYLFGILSSVAALLGFNYFFTVPLHTLAVNDSSYFTTFAIMTITAVMTSTLTSKGKGAGTAAGPGNDGSGTGQGKPAARHFP